jgi:hypothetical protein
VQSKGLHVALVFKRGRGVKEKLNDFFLASMNFEICCNM